MKIPVVITVFDRWELVARMADSFARTDWPDRSAYSVQVWDDGSADPRTWEAIRRLGADKVRRPGRVGMLANYQRAMDAAAATGAPHFLTVDSDALLHPAWLRKVTELHARLTAEGEAVAQATAFVTPLNGILEERDGYRVMKASGAVCCLFDAGFWRRHEIGRRTREHFQAALESRRRGRKAPFLACEHWIWKATVEAGAIVVGTRPSYAQHLGTRQHSSPSAPRAVALDFAGEGDGA